MTSNFHPKKRKNYRGSCLTKMERVAYYTAPVGILEIRTNGKSVIGLKKATTVGVADPDDDLVRAVRRELDSYFAGQLRTFSVPVALSGTAFQEQVWQALKKIPRGVTISYRDIAVQIGRPKACRAVGQAVHCNPVCIIVPCHRVIGSNGALVGYAEGLDMKQALLAVESP